MKKQNPRHGSMQFWPRVKAKKSHARVSSWSGDNQSLLGFAGYKVGMTHLMLIDNRATTKTKGKEIFCPATIIECPPLKAASIRFYQNSKALSQITAQKLDKEISSRIKIPKKNDFDGEYDHIRLVVYTQPKLTTIGKKKPEIFEVAIGGSKEEQLKYAKEKLGKDIHIEEIFKEGEQLDLHGVTTGRGFQGAVKRFGIGLTSHKSEKSRRNPGSLGGWKSQGHVMYRIAHAGQLGYHQRTEYNKWLLKLGKDSKEVEQKGGFLNYGLVKNPYIVLKGSVLGPKKRLIKFSHAIRPKKNIPDEAPAIKYISKESKQ